MKKKRIFLITFFIFCASLLSALPAFSAASDQAMLRGTITDVDGKPIAGARVFAYDDADIRRPANFMSDPSDAQGAYRMVLSAGRYRFVARLKKGAEFGPLLPGDKHSGDPVELDVAPGAESELNFTLADLKDARRVRAKSEERPITISGRILNEQGKPLSRAYAIAHRGRTIENIPDFVSAWADAEGRYSLTLPAGTYFIGCALTFPPEGNYFLQEERTIRADTMGIDIVLKQRPQH
jgi:hypothetical protein